MSFFKSFLLFVSILCFSNLHAQEKITLFKVGGNLLGLSDGDTETYGGAGLSIEHQLKRRTTLVLNGFFNTQKSSYSDGTLTLDARVNVTTFEPEFRFYPKAATDGYYVGGALAMHLIKAKISGLVSASDTDTQFGVGVVTGYQFALAKALHVQLGGGFGVILPNEDTDPLLRFNLNVMLGYQF